LASFVTVWFVVMRDRVTRIFLSLHPKERNSLSGTMALPRNVAGEEPPTDPALPETRNKALSGSQVAAGKFHLGYRPAFDGLRGVAIFLVVLIHAFNVPGCFGFIGVDIFFVLSGFLITSLLVEEWGRAGRISLRAFYVRRALRLLPALSVLLIFFIIFGASFHSHKRFLFDLKEASAALFYYMNWAWAFDSIPVTLLRHTWSLSVEEQFYLIWPLLLLLMLRYASRGSILNFILLGVFGSVVARILLCAGKLPDTPRMLCGLDTRADSLLIGCAIGIMLSCNLLKRSAAMEIFLRWSSVASLAGLAIIGLGFDMASRGMYYAGWLVISLLAGFLVLGLMAGTVASVHRLFENRGLVYLGKLSYSLYLWHDPVLRGFRDYDMPAWKQILLSFCVMIPMTLFSYYLVERPCLRLKKRFQKV
jgi:peptidoglycan/LPS O-acetylase OafA/YrhL